MPVNPAHVVAKLLADPDTFTTVLLAIIISEYGTEAFGWTPETIFRELQEDFVTPIHPANKDQITVGLTLITSDDFYTRPSKFVQICNVLSGSELSDEFDKADAAECAWGVVEATLLWPPENDYYHPEILHYIGRVMDEEGINPPPAVLQMALRDNQIDSLGHDFPRDDIGELSASYGVHANRTQEIEEMLTDNISRLLSQLAELPGMKDQVKQLAATLRGGSPGATVPK